jgi:hypothetical protein
MRAKDAVAPKAWALTLSQDEERNMIYLSTTRCSILVDESYLRFVILSLTMMIGPSDLREFFKWASAFSPNLRKLSLKFSLAKVVRDFLGDS